MKDERLQYLREFLAVVSKPRNVQRPVITISCSLAQARRGPARRFHQINPYKSEQRSQRDVYGNPNATFCKRGTLPGQPRSLEIIKKTRENAAQQKSLWIERRTNASAPYSPLENREALESLFKNRPQTMRERILQRNYLFIKCVAGVRRGAENKGKETRRRKSNNGPIGITVQPSVQNAPRMTA